MATPVMVMLLIREIGFGESRQAEIENLHQRLAGSGPRISGFSGFKSRCRMLARCATSIPFNT
jgi:hypothetical protein